MATPQDDYARLMEDIVKEFTNLGNEVIRQSILQMKILRAEIAAEITSIPAVDPYHIRGVINRLEDDIAQYQVSLTRTAGQAAQRAAQLGALLVVEPINALGLEVTWVSANPLIGILQEFTADLITGLSGDMLNKINAALRLAAMGGLSPYQAMQRIGDILGIIGDEITGIAYKAEMILRTELTRIFNMSVYSQQLAILNQIPGAQKAWMAVGDWRTRETHLHAHVEYTSNPIPIEEAYIVGGAFLQYPGDPAGPPGEVINCRCISVTIHPQIGYIETALDVDIRAEIKRRADEQRQLVPA